MGKRRSDTRQRIQQVALGLFAEHGYGQTSLQEVADVLEITRPALYYHFRTKEDILVGVVDDICASIDELVGWAAAQPETAAARREILDRLAEFLGREWRPLVRFTLVNQKVMDELPAGARMQAGMMSLLSLVRPPDADPVHLFQARLAVIALILGNAPLIDLGLAEGHQEDVAMTVARQLALAAT